LLMALKSPKNFDIPSTSNIFPFYLISVYIISIL
jgi:hypothetical protein